MYNNSMSQNEWWYLKCCAVPINKNVQIKGSLTIQGNNKYTSASISLQNVTIRKYK